MFRNADEVNGEFPFGWESLCDINIPVTGFIMEESEQFVRVFTDGTTDVDGCWLVKLSDIENIIDDPIAIKDFLSLPNIPDKIVTVNIPVGTRLRTGKSAPDFNRNRGV